MKQHLHIQPEEKVIILSSQIVYGQRIEWCGSTWRQLKMSFMRSRQYFSYDPQERLPLMIFFSGGGFTTVDRNVYMPELTWFAKRGYAAARIGYSGTARTCFAMQLEDAKLAIRFLKAHAEEYGIDPDRMIVMGESAGGYLCSLVGLTGKNNRFDTGDYQEYSSAVQGVIPFYPVVNTASLFDDQRKTPLPSDIKNFFNLTELIDKDTPPFLIFHGTADSTVPVEQSELLYDALTAHGIRADLYTIEGAKHADAHFFQPEIKQLILDFMNSVLGLT